MLKYSIKINQKFSNLVHAATQDTTRWQYVPMIAPPRFGLASSQKENIKGDVSVKSCVQTELQSQFSSLFPSSSKEESKFLKN